MDSAEARALSRTLNILYGVVFEENSWEDALAAVGGYVGGWCVHLSRVDFAVPERTSAVFNGISGEWASELQRHAVDDPWLAAYLKSPPGTYIGNQLVPDNILRESPTHDRILHSIDVGQVVFGSISRSETKESFLSVNRSANEQAFDEVNRSRCATLIHHLKQIMQVTDFLSREQARAVAFKRALDQVKHAAVLLDRAGCVLFENSPFSHLKAFQPTLFEPKRNCLTFSQPRTQTQFKLALRSGAASTFLALQNEQVLPCQVLPIRMPDCHGCYISSPVNERKVWLLIIHQKQRNEAGLSALLSDVFGATAAECRVAAGLVRGLTPRQYADRSGLSIGTVRTQLKQVMRKCGCHSQNALISFLSRFTY